MTPHNPGFHGWLLAALIALTALAAGQFLMTISYAPVIAKGLLASPAMIFRVGAHVLLAALLATSVAMLFLRVAFARPLLIGWASLTLTVSVWTALLDGRFNLGSVWPLVPLLYVVQSRQLRATLVR